MRILILIIAISVAGCTTPHNDVLVFGTNTSLGVDVGVQPETGSAPQITIGYKRQEAVYMPLTINARDSAFACKTWNSKESRCEKFHQLTGDAKELIAKIKYTGTGEPWTQNSFDTTGGGADAYSVFASFGGSVSGKSSEASMALAQFFATGIAAQRLSASSQVTSLISTASAKEQELRRIAELENALGVANVELVETRTLEQQGRKMLLMQQSLAVSIAEFVCVDSKIQPDRVDTLFPDQTQAALKQDFQAVVGNEDCNADEIATSLTQGRLANHLRSIQLRIPKESE